MRCTRMANLVRKMWPSMTFTPCPKTPIFRSQKLRDFAGDCETCMNCGKYAPKQIVLCHPEGQAYGKGMGLKGHDLGAFMCSRCHDIYDGRLLIGWTPDERETMFLRAVYKTVLWLLQNGKLRVAA